MEGLTGHVLVNFTILITFLCAKEIFGPTIRRKPRPGNEGGYLLAGLGYSVPFFGYIGHSLWVLYAIWIAG